MTTLATETATQHPIAPAVEPPGHANYAIYVIALHMSLAGFLYGFDTGSIGPITEMPQFQNDVGQLSQIVQGIYVSCILLFAALSSFGNGYLADRFSRKYTILLGAVLAAMGAILSSSVANLP